MKPDTNTNTKTPATSDINLLSEFLAHEQVNDLASHPPVDCITICASAVLYQTARLFQILERHPDLTKSLVLCGGIGHSTPLIYQAVSRHPTYHAVASDIEGLPEARVLEKILTSFFDLKKITSRGCRILVEDQSTNCGANASKTKELLEKTDIETPKSMIIVQDPTMALRTIASFQKTYEGIDIEIKSAPIFIPLLRDERSDWPMRWDMDAMGIEHQNIPQIPRHSDMQVGRPHLEARELWEKERFFDLITGEVPRLRDDVEGYGPNGKGFIAHVDVPYEVEAAWKRLVATLGRSR
ncbi:related to DUF218 domain protein [Phialocephala subalpina]|uniref:Related to DUF218 domain protein n=1 Tax=Phialocephala subalpina TaxID=576137 RepID=A0A1L7XM43_9HELO|nr:related to DUF218 domain protein [Phialocephala subalpina]